MKVMVVGGGGRENAICWKIAQSPLLEKLYCAPGNPGINALATPVPIAADEVGKLADFASEEGIDLTVVGPELPLWLGIADEFKKRGLAVFGPQRRAAEMEASKVFAKEFMDRHGIPTAPFRVAHTAEEARAAARELSLPVVFKADGLAAGKGVLIVRSPQELEEAMAVFYDERRFGAGAERVVVESCLEGEEVSFMVLCDGSHLLPLASSKDYKRIGEGDEGPNTGGMGSHTPSVVLSADEANAVLDVVMRPAVEGLAREGREFVGVLYAGLMLTDQGSKVLEFNVRLGDPEAQCLLLRLEDDLLPVLASGAAGEFSMQRLRFRPEVAVCIVLASEGYPGTPARGDLIEGLDRAASYPGVEVFHAGTALVEGRLVSAGGRVLNVCATGGDLPEALRAAYQAAGEITWDHKVLRRDIGRRVLQSG